MSGNMKSPVDETEAALTLAELCRGLYAILLIYTVNKTERPEQMCAYEIVFLLSEDIRFFMLNTGT